MNRMPPDLNPDNPDTLDHALDALAHGDRSGIERLDPVTRQTIDQLIGWSLIGGVEGGRSELPGASYRPLNPATAMAAVTPRWKGSVPVDIPAPMPPLVVPSAPKSGRTMASAFWSAVAWLMIAAVAGASLYGAVPSFREGDQPDPTMTAFQPGPATPNESADPREVNYGGDAGRTWNLAGADPATGDPVVTPAGPKSQTVGSPLIVGDAMFYATVDGRELRYHRYDLVSAESAWESDVAIIGSAASDGDRLFGFTMRNPGTDASTPVPVAISIETGALVWEGPPLVLGSDARAAGPVLRGGMVYFSDALGNTMALDSATGAVAWQYPETSAPRVTYAGADVMVGNPPDADIVATAHGIFVERPSTTIVKLDPETGEKLDSFNLIDEYGADIQQVALQATADRLVISASRSEKAPLGADAPPPYRPTSILIFETGSLDLVAKSGMPEIASNMVLTDDAILVAGRTDLTGPISVYQIDLATGDVDVDDPIHEFERGATSWSGLSASGTTLMVVDSINQFAFIDLASGATVTSGTMDTESGELLSAPFQLWGELPITVTSIGHIVVIGRIPE